jgi:hypothetical protein
MRNEMPIVSQSAPQVASPILPEGFQLLGRGSKTEIGTSLNAGPEPVRTRVHLVAQPVGGTIGTVVTIGTKETVDTVVADDRIIRNVISPF